MVFLLHSRLHVHPIIPLKWHQYYFLIRRQKNRMIKYSRRQTSCWNVEYGCAKDDFKAAIIVVFLREKKTTPASTWIKPESHRLFRKDHLLLPHVDRNKCVRNKAFISTVTEPENCDVFEITTLGCSANGPRMYPRGENQYTERRAERPTISAELFNSDFKQGFVNPFFVSCSTWSILFNVRLIHQPSVSPIKFLESFNGFRVSFTSVRSAFKPSYFISLGGRFIHLIRVSIRGLA